MNRNRYKRYGELGDEVIPKRTAHRYRNVILPQTDAPMEEQNSPTSCYALPEVVNDVIECHVPNIEINNDEINDDKINNLIIDDDIIVNNEMDSEEILYKTELINDLDEYLHMILLKDKIAESSQSSQNPRSLDEMINSNDFFDPLSITVEVSKAELLLMMLKFSIVNCLSVTAIANLFKLVNTIFQSQIMPDSRYLVDKLFDPMGDVEFHAVCYNCMAYIGNFNEIRKVKQCHICNTELDLSNPTNTSFFMLINPSSQIKDLITTNKDHYEYVMKQRVHKSNCIEDVYDSKEYRKFVNSLPENERTNYISAVFNTDGASKFKCSKYSIWPLYIMLNELPKQERMSKLVTCGLWFNKQKPDMSVLLSPFVDMMNRITKNGISCTINEEIRHLKLHIISCCVDSVARAPVQGLKQFNGTFGCNWCLHPGLWVQDAMKYSLLEMAVDLRDHKSTIRDMMIATPRNPINGIKYPSPLINLPFFNIISGFVPDYMHCCLEGVAKQLTEYYISTMNSDDIAEIDSKINKITAPHQIARLSRPLISRNDWKAREWENYTLYYSVIVLSDHLKRDYYYHWLLFVESLYILLQDTINVSEINRANEMLYEFVQKTEKLFGQKAMTYNIHQLLHLAESVINWGPLWCHSTFSFESANHNLLKAIKSSKGVTSQIIRFLKLNHTVSVLKERAYPHVDIAVNIYCDNILDSKIKNCLKMTNITYFGKGNSIDTILVDTFGLSVDALEYSRIVKDGCLYEYNSAKTRRSNNSFILLNDNRFARIAKFIADEDNKREFTVCNIIKTRKCFTKNYHMLRVIEKIEPDHIIIPTSAIKTICVFMNLEKMYLIPVPNLLHY